MKAMVHTPFEPSVHAFSNKPSPAYVAEDSFGGDLLRRDLAETKKICRRHSCPLEFILKDISTVHNEPERFKK